MNFTVGQSFFDLQGLTDNSTLLESKYFIRTAVGVCHELAFNCMFGIRFIGGCLHSVKEKAPRVKDSKAPRSPSKKKIGKGERPSYSVISASKAFRYLDKGSNRTGAGRPAYRIGVRLPIYKYIQLLRLEREGRTIPQPNFRATRSRVSRGRGLRCFRTGFSTGQSGVGPQLTEAKLRREILLNMGSGHDAIGAPIPTTLGTERIFLHNYSRPCPRRILPLENTPSTTVYLGEPCQLAWPLPMEFL